MKMRYGLRIILVLLLGLSFVLIGCGGGGGGGSKGNIPPINPPSPTIDYSPTSISFTATQDGSNPTGQNLNISSTGGGAVNWAVSSNAAWLSLNPLSGTNGGSVTVEVNIAGLAAGTYNAIITITATGATNSPVSISVSLTINPPSPSPTVRELFVAERGFGVYVFDPSLSGANVNPLRTITKGAPAGLPGKEMPGLLDAFDVAVDLVNKEIFVTEINGASVLVYPLSANEDTLPIRVISGLKMGGFTFTEYPNSIKVDTKNDEILVLTSNGRIFIFPRTANGDISEVPPLRVLTPRWAVNDLAVDSNNNELFLTTNDSIRVFRRETDGNYTLLRTIMANPLISTSFNGIAVDTKNNEIFMTVNGVSIQVFGRTDDGYANPKRTIEGNATGLDGANFIEIDAVNNEVFVSNWSNWGNRSIKVYARTASGNISPLRSLSRSPQNNAVGIALAIY